MCPRHTSRVRSEEHLKCQSSFPTLVFICFVFHLNIFNFYLVLMLLFVWGWDLPWHTCGVREELGEPVLLLHHEGLRD